MTSYEDITRLCKMVKADAHKIFGQMVDLAIKDPLTTKKLRHKYVRLVMLHRLLDLYQAGYIEEFEMEIAIPLIPIEPIPITLVKKLIGG